jgi:hypothetical protein
MVRQRHPHGGSSRDVASRAFGIGCNIACRARRSPLARVRRFRHPMPAESDPLRAARAAGGGWPKSLVAASSLAVPPLDQCPTEDILVLSCAQPGVVIEGAVMKAAPATI